MHFVPISRDRYLELIDGCAVLTLEENESGWHFCKQFNGLLINPTSPEWQGCACRSKIKFLEDALLVIILKKQEVDDYWLKVETVEIDGIQAFVLKAKTHKDDEEKF